MGGPCSETPAPRGATCQAARWHAFWGVSSKPRLLDPWEVSRLCQALELTEGTRTKMSSPFGVSITRVLVALRHVTEHHGTSRLTTAPRHHLGVLLWVRNPAVAQLGGSGWGLL